MSMIHLFIERYAESNPARAAEYDYCLATNLRNPWIGQVHVLAMEEVKLPPHPKLQRHFLPDRATFAEALDLAQGCLRADDVALLANADIAFADDSLNQIDRLGNGDAWAVTRREFSEGRWSIAEKPDSQDFWMLRAPLPMLPAQFHFGVPGCDNRFAVLLAEAGLTVRNPAKHIAGEHHHQTNVRNYTRAQEVAPPYQLCPVEALPALRPLRVVHLALRARHGINHSLENGLSTLGAVKSLDWSALLKTGGLAGLQKAIMETVAIHQPDLLFCQLQGPDVLLPKTAAQIHRPIVNWSGDVRQPLPDWFRDLGRAGSITLFTNLTDVETMQSEGLTAGFLQVGFDDTIYCPTGPKDQAAPEIVFMGSLYPPDTFPLSAERVALIEFLERRYGQRFGVYGNHPRGRANLLFHPASEAAVYRQAKIGINFSHFCRPRYTSDRLLRITGCGCCALSQYYPRMEQEFIPGVHLETFDDLDDLGRQIDALLDDEPRRAELARTGCDWVHRSATWSVRFKELRRLLNV